MVASLLAVLAIVTAVVGCDEEEGEGQTYACRYDYSTYSVDEYGINFDEYTDECVEVSSPAECDEITETENECYDGFCVEWTYTNVEVHAGGCDAE